MEFVTYFTSFFSYALPFLIVLTVVVFFHELGHFLVARWCGVAVEVFSIGFGPEIAGVHDRKGTRWKLSWIPLGGYVKFLGDSGEASAPDREALSSLPEEQRKNAFHLKPLWQRAAVVAAGPIANFILAIVIFTFMFSVVGRMVTEPRVDVVQPGSAAAEAGFLPGDVVRAINGTKISHFSELQRIVNNSAGVKLAVEVNRDGKRLVLDVVPRLKEIKDRFGNIRRVGLLGIVHDIRSGKTVHERVNPARAAWMGVKEVYFIIENTFSYLGKVITGREKADQLGGPLRIAQVSGQVASVSYIALVNLAAILSVSIGLINLFPVPMLDGGHLLFYFFEAVRGKPLSERMQEIGYRIGLALVLMLMIFATWNDLVNLKVF